MPTIQSVPLSTFKPNPRNARTHSKKQIREIADSIAAFGFVMPILTDDNGMIIAGHGRLEAAKILGLQEAPAIILDGLSDAKKRALLIADNKIAQNAGWDRERLAAEFPELTDLLIEENLDISITAFESVEIDQIVTDFGNGSRDPPDRLGPAG